MEVRGHKQSLTLDYKHQVQLLLQLDRTILWMPALALGQCCWVPVKQVQQSMSEGAAFLRPVLRLGSIKVLYYQCH